MDFLKYPEDKKYNLQVVNPPYAKNESADEDGNVTYKRPKNHTLVRDFIEKFTICKDGGFIVYIVPNTGCH